jgi:2-hydroxychromene-2-carboxylate isomerase
LKLQFWFEFASTYSYPAAMRVDKAARAKGVEVEWRPFMLGPIFRAQQGKQDSPFIAIPCRRFRDQRLRLRGGVESRIGVRERADARRSQRVELIPARLEHEVEVVAHAKRPRRRTASGTPR